MRPTVLASDTSVARELLARLDPRERTLMACSAVLELLERLALVGAVVELVHDRRSAIAVGFGVAALLLVRRFVVATVTRRVRATLMRLGVDAVLESDVLQGVFSEEDAGTTLFRGLFEAERFAAQVVPSLVGSSVAVALLSLASFWFLPSRALAVGGVALVLGAGAVLLVRSVTARAMATSDDAYMPVVDAVLDAIGGRLELVASGRDADFRRDLGAAADRWSRVAARADRVTGLAGRFPLAAVMGVAGGAVLVDATTRGAVLSAALGDAAALAAGVPAVMGALRSIVEAMKSVARITPLVALLTSKRRPLPSSLRVSPTVALPACIEWRDVSFSYASIDAAPAPVALRGCQLTWRPGATLILRGPNGSGKSTLLKMLLGLARPHGGAIVVGERDLFDIDLIGWRRAVGFLPQRPYMSERSTVRSAMQLIARDADDATLRRALEDVELWSALTARSSVDPLAVRVATLSTGQRQRLALARVLSQDAQIYLLDEPDANLDAAGIELVARLVRHLSRERMVAVAVHTHELIDVGNLVATVDGGVVTATAIFVADDPQSARV